MKTTTFALAAGALALALLAPTMAPAAGVTILDEGFDDMSAFAEWSQFNNVPGSSPGWTKGDPATFAAQSGAADSYLGAAIIGSGFDLWLITPVLDFSGMSTLSFSLRSHGNAPHHQDVIELRFDDGTGVFNTFLGGTFGFATAPNSWTPITLTFDQAGSGRLAIRYEAGAGIDYAGIDSIKVVTTVPEPASGLMLVMGLAGVVALRRRWS